MRINQTTGYTKSDPGVTIKDDINTTLWLYKISYTSKYKTEVIALRLII
jgi:hypothetical protein